MYSLNNQDAQCLHLQDLQQIDVSPGIFPLHIYYIIKLSFCQDIFFKIGKSFFEKINLQQKTPKLIGVFYFNLIFFLKHRALQLAFHLQPHRQF